MWRHEIVSRLERSWCRAATRPLVASVHSRSDAAELDVGRQSGEEARTGSQQSRSTAADALITTRAAEERLRLARSFGGDYPTFAPIRGSSLSDRSSSDYTGKSPPDGGLRRSSSSSRKLVGHQAAVAKAAVRPQLPRSYDEGQSLLFSNPFVKVFLREREGGPQELDTIATCHQAENSVVTETGEKLRLLNQIDSEASGAIAFHRGASGRDRLQPGCRLRAGTTVVYLALLHGHLPSDRIHCRAPVCIPTQGYRDFRLAGERTEGQAAYSIFVAIARGEYEGMSVTLTEIRPVQGPRSLPRLHAACLGHAVVGDQIYGGPRGSGARHPSRLVSPPLLLHSWVLRIGPPLSGTEVVVAAPDTLSPMLALKPRLSRDCVLMDDSVIVHELPFFEERGLTSWGGQVSGSTVGDASDKPAEDVRPVGCSGDDVANCWIRFRSLAGVTQQPYKLPGRYSDSNTY
ncbi:pseudouridine synthase, partial [Cystoisospora suis]